MPVGAGWLSVQGTGVARGSMGTCRLVECFVRVGMFWQIQSDIFIIYLILMLNYGHM